MYEEMRIYRPSSTPATAPWLMTPTTRQLSFREDDKSADDKKRLRLGSTPTAFAAAIALSGAKESSSMMEITPRDDQSFAGTVSDDDAFSDAMLTARDEEQTPVANLTHGSSYFGHDYARGILEAAEDDQDADVDDKYFFDVTSDHHLDHTTASKAQPSDHKAAASSYGRK
jgi:hypothetical protein